MKVCIIIPVFNEEEFIEKSINSIINQTVKPEKVIYVNDSSTDNTKKIIDKMDHKNLNLEVDFLEGVITSAENIVLGIYNELFDDIKKMGKHLHCVRLNETENNYVEYYG